MKIHITEKSYAHAAATPPVFTFLVAVGDTTSGVKQWIKRVYGKDVVGVRFLRNPRKQINRKRITGKTMIRRKALVTLKSGQRIDDFNIKTDDKKEKKRS